MAKHRQTIIFVLACIICSSCSTTRTVPEGDQLYTGARVEVSGPDLTTKQKKSLRSELAGITRPRPNSRVLGIPFKLLIYNMFGNRKPDSFFGKLRDKFGEPPVLLSDLDLEHNTKILENHLENRGFFNAGVTGDTIVKKKKAHAEFAAATGHQYHIDSISFDGDSSRLAQVIRESSSETLLVPGNPYDLDVIKGERLRIDAFLKERGFYYFNPDFLLVQVDSTDGTHKVDMRVIIKPDVPEPGRTPYTINNVFIYSGYNLTTASLDTNKANAQFYEGYYIIDRRKRFKPKLFAHAMQFKPGELYNRTDHNLSINRLINLDEFKFVRNRFEPVPDSARLDAYYYLTPHPKKSLRAEVTGTVQSNGFNGSELTVRWRNRNTFGAGEQLTISAYVGAETQAGGQAVTGTNAFRTGAEANFTIPRFIIPFFDVRTRGGFMPRTNIRLGYDILNRREFYSLNQFRGGLGYIWKESLRKQHEFYPININYVQPLNITEKFLDSVARYTFLRRVIDSQFIIGSTYQFTYNQVIEGLQKTNNFFFNGLADFSGNIAGLLTGASKENPGTILGRRFNQYIKLEADGRYYRKLGLKSSWANRLLVGYGIPYGNSEQLPYIKQFFAGGTNSIRAFRSRTIGPGSFPLLALDKTVFPDQTGDIRLEANTEFRPHISGPLYGALFVDAGNIWLAKEDPTRPGSAFSKNFLNELAIGAGVGVRLDITLFVIRLDVAFPIRKPWEDNPWYLRQLHFGRREWRRENVVYNLAIGYPF
ncbi:MAG: BamA/TamA family outer membrane protein [Chitinophagaceae bacterium]